MRDNETLRLAAPHRVMDELILRQLDDLCAGRTTLDDFEDCVVDHVWGHHDSALARDVAHALVEPGDKTVVMERLHYVHLEAQDAAVAARAGVRDAGGVSAVELVDELGRRLAQ